MFLLFVKTEVDCCISILPSLPSFFFNISIALDSRVVMIGWPGLCQCPPSIKRGERNN